jgi:hypothetical protein
VRPIMRDFRVLDNDQAGHSCQQRNVVERSMRDCALLLLLCGVRWLQDEDALDKEEEGGGIDERMRVKEDELAGLAEYAAPYYCC